ncbi:MAG: toprim domain-containing protein [Methylomonas lenta]|nr:toprim domain-containing protein [Methylomonas lenta]
MRLFIAEKPDLAKAIVEGLGGGSRKDGYYDCGNDFVTWCYGHMLKLLDPEDYDPRFSKWNMADLPISHIP